MLLLRNRSTLCLFLSIINCSINMLALGTGSTRTLTLNSLCGLWRDDTQHLCGNLAGCHLSVRLSNKSMSSHQHFLPKQFETVIWSPDQSGNYLHQDYHCASILLCRVYNWAIWTRALFHWQKCLPQIKRCQEKTAWFTKGKIISRCTGLLCCQIMHQTLTAEQFQRQTFTQKIGASSPQSKPRKKECLRTNIRSMVGK